MINFSQMKSVASELAKEYPIKSLFCFGSYADGTQTEDSDVDFLVEFFTPSISLITLSGLRLDLEERLGLHIDLVHSPIPEESYLIINITVLIYEHI
jgi:predicted nucleotidyltransferase